MQESLRQEIMRQYNALKTERESFISHWREISEHTLPRAPRFLATDRNKGDKRNQKRMESTSTLAVRTLASGMMAGITNPARPWFRLSLARNGVLATPAVKAWLADVEKRMSDVFIRSNLYNVLPQAYSDLCVFGTHAMSVIEDEEDVIRCCALPVGSYVLANSWRNQVDMVIREFQMTVRQLVQRFGMDSVSSATRAAWMSGNKEMWVGVLHFVGPNNEFDESRAAAKFKRYRSVYLELSGDEHDAPLSESGYDELPYLCPRWTTTGEDVYGSSPGMDALPDIKALQLLQKRKMQIIDKGSNPPMTAPSSLRNSHVSLLPGDVTYLDVQTGQQGFQPAYKPDPGWITAVSHEIAETEHRIKRAFFEDLFLMLANDRRSGITAREIDERHEEKLLMLGPVLERLSDELLDPLIDRTFEIMGRMGALPDAPEEISGEPLKVEYISVMAQAMRMVGMSSLERLMGFVGNLAGANPTVLDKINMDAAVDSYAESIGVAPGVVLAANEASAIREQRAQQQAQQQAMQAAAAGAQGAKLLSETDTESDNALTRLLGVAA